MSNVYIKKFAHLFIESKHSIMSAKGGINMNESLNKFYREHFANHNDNDIINTAEYKIRCKKQDDIINQIEAHLLEQISVQEAVGLLNNLNDATYHLVDLYRYHDFKYSFLTGIQLGIEAAKIEHPDLILDDVLKLLFEIKEKNS